MKIPLIAFGGIWTRYPLAFEIYIFQITVIAVVLCSFSCAQSAWTGSSIVCRAASGCTRSSVRSRFRRRRVCSTRRSRTYRARLAPRGPTCPRRCEPNCSVRTRCSSRTWAAASSKRALSHSLVRLLRLLWRFSYKSTMRTCYLFILLMYC